LKVATACAGEPQRQLVRGNGAQISNDGMHGARRLSFEIHEGKGDPLQVSLQRSELTVALKIAPVDERLY